MSPTMTATVTTAMSTTAWFAGLGSRNTPECYRKQYRSCAQKTLNHDASPSRLTLPLSSFYANYESGSLENFIFAENLITWGDAPFPQAPEGAPLDFGGWSR
jgi:hypothetical protein